MYDLKGKTALITGAAQGIGKETAKMLAKHGAQVCVADLNIELVREVAHELEGIAVEMDVTQPGDWESSVETVQREMGRLDILVNNAGIMTTKPFVAMSLEEFQREHAVNVEGVWLGMQHCFPLLSQSAQSTAGSSIINLSSIYGKVAGPGVAAYCATKGAVLMLSKSVAIEFAKMESGVRVNTVHPGPVNTALVANAAVDAVEQGMASDVEAGMAAIVAAHPMGRMAETTDIAGAITFLASDHSRFMTGAEIVVDGGYSVV